MEEIAELWMLRSAVASNAVDDHDPSRCLDVQLAHGGCRTAAVILSSEVKKSPVCGRVACMRWVRLLGYERCHPARQCGVFSLFEWEQGIEYSAVGHVCSLGVNSISDPAGKTLDPCPTLYDVAAGMVGGGKVSPGGDWMRSCTI